MLDGPFRKGAWEIKVFPYLNSDDVIDNHACPVENKTPYLTRKLGTEAELEPIASDLEACLRLDQYDVSPWNEEADRTVSFRSCLEGWGHDRMDNHLHNTAHFWVGGIFMDTVTGTDKTEVQGSMAAVDTSPNDPVFFLHHANVDRLWALWEQRHGNAYVPTGMATRGGIRGTPSTPSTRKSTARTGG